MRNQLRLTRARPCPTGARLASPSFRLGKGGQPSARKRATGWDLIQKIRMVTDLSEIPGVGTTENTECQDECSDLGDALNITMELKAFSGAFVQTPSTECKRESSHSIQNSCCRAGRQGQQACLSPPLFACDTHWVLNGQSEAHFSARPPLGEDVPRKRSQGQKGLGPDHTVTLRLSCQCP